MVRKGLCSTCMHDKECTFSRTFPVLQCEEFSSCEPKSADEEKVKQKKPKLKK